MGAMAQAPLPTPCISSRAKHLPGSPIRALLATSREAGVVDLAGGIPEPALFPDEALVEAAAKVMRDGGEALQYAPTAGLPALRAWVASRLTQRGLHVSEQQVFITQGSQHALAAVAVALTGPDQPVAIEQPGYLGARQAFLLAEAPRLPLPVTPQGWDLSALRGHPPAAIYAMAHFQNPTGRSATPTATRELCTWAEAHGTWLVEDDAYGELPFLADSTQPLIAEAPTRGILLGTLSKTLCPGLRIGWICAPQPLCETLDRVLQATALQPGTLAQHLAMAVISSLDWNDHLRRLRALYGERARRLAEDLSRLDLDVERPMGGFFLWAGVRGSAQRVSAQAARHGLLVLPEGAFQTSNVPGADTHLRIAWTRYRGDAASQKTLSRALGRAQSTLA